MPQEWALRTEVPALPHSSFCCWRLGHSHIRAESRAFVILAFRACPSSPGWPHLGACALGASATAQDTRSCPQAGVATQLPGLSPPLHHRPLLTKHMFQDKITDNFKTATAPKHWTKLEGPSERGGRSHHAHEMSWLHPWRQQDNVTLAPSLHSRNVF